MPLIKPRGFDETGEYTQPEDLWPLIDAINDGIAIVSNPPLMDRWRAASLCSLSER